MSDSWAKNLDDAGSHGWVRYNKVRLPADAVLGEPGKAFELAQKRLGGGRIHHAMRTVAYCRKALDMLCERALSRTTQGGPLAEKQSVQNYIADSFIQLEQFRLLVLYAAWWCDRGDPRKSRTYISAVKVQAAEVLHDIVRRAVQVHGALGLLQRNTTGRPVDDGSPHGRDGRAQRGAPGDSRKTGPAPLPAFPQTPCGRTSGYRKARGGPGEIRPLPGRHRGKSVMGERTEEEHSPQIDTDALARWMDRQGLPGSGQSLSATFISGGASNEIFELRRGEAHMALRKPPAKVPKGRNEIMLREYR